MSAVKNHEIPKLDNYVEIPDSSFWEKFPKRELPLVVETTVNIDAFAAKIIEELRFRANAFQKPELPPVNTVNAKSASENGEILTDTIASWTKKRFVAGPFDSPPLPGFHVPWE